MVIEVEEISIPGMAIDMIETCQAEVSTIDWKNVLIKGAKNKSIRQIRKYFMLCHVSIYHWANDYPNKVKEDSSNNDRVTVYSRCT